MRYFKYDQIDNGRDTALRARYRALSDREGRIYRKRKRWQTFGIIAACISFSAVFIAGSSLLKLLPGPNGWFWRILAGLGKAIAGLLIVVIAGAAMVVPLKLIEKAASPDPSAMKKELLSEACRHLRSYYGLQGSVIVTKCFDAADDRFKNRDVCVFIAGDELRITADLIHGFLHAEGDLGCYAFTKQEIVLSERPRGEHPAAELRAGEAVFLLGHRAKKFIEKNFIGKDPTVIAADEG